MGEEARTDGAVLRIEGGRSLNGSLRVQGSKNGALPVLAAALLCEGETVLDNCPRIRDTETALDILASLGCRASRDGGAVTVDARGVRGCTIGDALARRMRSSVVFLGALLARTGCAEVAMPGGCQLGPRPVDMHLEALSRMGVEVRQESDWIRCSTRGMTGCELALPFPSVGATENVLLAAATAEGTTSLHCAACEPEIAELAAFLNACGARIAGAGTPEITVDGVASLQGCRYRLGGDRVVAATYMAAAAATGGDVELTGIDPAQLVSVREAFARAGCAVTCSPGSLRLSAPPRLRQMGTIRTLPYPGFPTDAQALAMAAACVAEGTTVFVENIFAERYKHCPELERMGARIRQFDRIAVVEGVPGLRGARVEAQELRGGAALAVAALAASGVSEISGVGYIERGYADIAADLVSLGARIERGKG